MLLDIQFGKLVMLLGYLDNQNIQLGQTIINQFFVVNMQSLSMLKKPIQLKPSPPASVHILSYSSFQTQKMKQNYELQKHQSLLAQIKQLSQTIYKQGQTIQQLKEEHLKQILLFQFQLKHQRDVTSRYDAEMRKFQNSRNQLQSFYEMKLQLVKKEIIDNYQRQINQEKQKTVNDLKQIRENYCTKIALIAEQNRQRQYDVVEVEQRFRNFEIKLSLAESKLAQKQRIISSQTSKLMVLEQKQHEIQLQKGNLVKGIEQLKQQFTKNTESLRSRAQQSEYLKDQMQKRYQSIQNQFLQIQTYNKELQRERNQLLDQKQLALRKYNKVQKELDELLNRRKTKDKNQGRIIVSGRETERDRERSKDRQKQRQKEREREKQRQKQRQKQREREKQRQQQRERQKQRQQQRERDRQQISNLEGQNLRLIEQITKLKRRIIELQDQQPQISQSHLVQLTQLQQTQKQIKGKYEQIFKQNTILKQNITKIQKEKNHYQSQLLIKAQQYQSKLQAISGVSEQLQQQYKFQLLELQNLHKKIESTYLQKIQQNVAKINDLQTTLSATQQIMQNQAKERRNLMMEVQQLRQGAMKKK